MVMKNMMGKNLRQTILRSLGRFIAIVAIIALGSAIFVGLRITKTDMVATGQKYTDEQNMFDLRLLSTYGWSQKDVDIIAQMDGIAAAEGTVTLDVFAGFGSDEDEIYRLYSIPKQVNKVYLLGGRMPSGPDECLVDGAHADDSVLGTTLTVSRANDEDTLDSLKYTTYTVVGYVSTPIYMDMTRGSTNLGSGNLASYVYIPEEAFNVDYYTEINVTIPGEWVIYSDAYTDAMDSAADELAPRLTPLAHDRFLRVLEEAWKAYADGMMEYEDGLQEYESGKAEAEAELANALKQLQDAQAEIDETRQLLLDGQTQLQEGQTQIDEGYAAIDKTRVELEKAKADTAAQIAAARAELAANKKTVKENLKAVEEGLSQIQDGLEQIDDGISQIEDGLDQIDSYLPQIRLMISLYESSVSSTQAALNAVQNSGNDTLIAQLEQRLTEQQTKLDEYTQQQQQLLDTQAQLEEQLAQLQVQREEVAAQQARLEETKQTLNDALTAIEEGYDELDANEDLADSQFAASEAQMSAAEAELKTAQQELDAKKVELEEGLTALETGQEELDTAWKEYEEGRADAEAELADAKQKLDDATVALSHARKTIDDMGEPDVFVLNRNTNAGYLALDSNSDIVSGISRVFPLFFLLIAALVCITTMTRMVDEERTQIGTLKALGYSNMSIISKYLYYSGIAAIVGCGLGVAAGSVIFPWILWTAYGIIFNITPGVVLTFDWQLSLGVVISYFFVSTLVTYLCCRRTLREVPAELIRPKAPTSGKKIFLEYLPFWNKISFLNKVMLRNIFRYRQRLLMMMVGIGGCTALLLTGFGLRDTVMTIVDQQFEEVTRFDIEVYFSEGKSEQEQLRFTQEMTGVQDASFFYQTSVELAHEDRVRDIYLMVCDESIQSFFDFRWEREQLQMPGKGEALLSVGMSELLGVKVGDAVAVRDSDLQELQLTVTGIFENHVYNYLIVSPETLEDQWGKVPSYQTAFLQVRDGMDIHTVSAGLSGRSDVMSVVISEDQAEIVNNMMDALNLVVVTIVICAGLLAVIVLYNLTNININERIREISTIKVLGFNAGETSAYVFKENICLTAVGALLGLLGGRALLEFVMTQIKIDMVWFLTRLDWPSYLYAIGLTILSALIVVLIFHKKLDNINMAEALKSVE